MCNCRQLVEKALKKEPSCLAYWAYLHPNGEVIVKRWNQGVNEICDRCWEENQITQNSFVRQVSDIIIARN